jgi:hypothetical protein
LGQLPHQGVFATAGADDQKLHGRIEAGNPAGRKDFVGLCTGAFLG